MQQHYEELSNTEKYFIVILLALYAGFIITAALTIGDYVPCVLDLEPESKCNFGDYFAGLTPFLVISYALSCATVLSAYYLNKLSKKSIVFFRLLFIPPLVFLVYYFYYYGAELLKAFM